MSDIQTTVTLSLETSVALRELAARTGLPENELATAAIDRLIDYERQLAEDIEAAREDVRAGRTVSHEDMMNRLEDIIAEAERRRA